MVKAISSVRQNGLANQRQNIKKSQNIAFSGTPVKLAEEVANPIGKMLKRFLGKAELPFSERPLTANADLVHILPDGTPINIPMPELHTAATKILDGSNILNPDAADLLTTKAALASVLSDSHGAVDALATGANALATKTGLIDLTATGLDALGTKSDLLHATATAVQHKSTIVDIAGGIAEVLDKLPL